MKRNTISLRTPHTKTWYDLLRTIAVDPFLANRKFTEYCDGEEFPLTAYDKWLMHHITHLLYVRYKQPIL